MLFRDTIKSLKIDESNPFLVSKIDGNELKENPIVLSDNLATITMFGEKKVILLNLLYTTITQTIEKLISDNITEKNNDFVLDAHCSNCSTAAALKVSHAAITTFLFLSLSIEAIFPAVVVLPDPLTPINKIT